MRKLVLILSLIVSTVATTGALAQNYAKWNWYLGAAHGRQESSVGSLIVSEGGETFPPIQPCSSDGADALGSHLQRVFCDQSDFNSLPRGSGRPRIASAADLLRQTRLPRLAACGTVQRESLGRHPRRLHRSIQSRP